MWEEPAATWEKLCYWVTLSIAYWAGLRLNLWPHRQQVQDVACTIYTTERVGLIKNEIWEEPGATWENLCYRWKSPSLRHNELGFDWANHHTDSIGTKCCTSPFIQLKGWFNIKKVLEEPGATWENLCYWWESAFPLHIELVFDWANDLTDSRYRMLYFAIHTTERVGLIKKWDVGGTWSYLRKPILLMSHPFHCILS